MTRIFLALASIGLMVGGYLLIYYGVRQKFPPLIEGMRKRNAN